jgi:hypothetical protein
MKVQAVCACRLLGMKRCVYDVGAVFRKPIHKRSTNMTLPIPEPLDIPDPNIDDPALPSSVPVDDPEITPAPPGADPTIGDPPNQTPPERA